MCGCTANFLKESSFPSFPSFPSGRTELPFTTKGTELAEAAMKGKVRTNVDTTKLVSGGGRLSGVPTPIERPSKTNTMKATIKASTDKVFDKLPILKKPVIGINPKNIEIGRENQPPPRMTTTQQPLGIAVDPMKGVVLKPLPNMRSGIEAQSRPRATALPNGESFTSEKRGFLEGITLFEGLSMILIALFVFYLVQKYLSK